MYRGVSCQGDLGRRTTGDGPGACVRSSCLYALRSRARHRVSSPTGREGPLPALLFLLDFSKRRLAAPFGFGANRSVLHLRSMPWSGRSDCPVTP